MTIIIASLLAISTHPSVYQRQADAALAQGSYQAASDLYQKASLGYAAKGDPNAAVILRERSLRYGTTIRWFVRRPVEGASGPLAVHEPVAGCYLGANIEREEATHDPQAFNNLVQKHHAMFFRYRAYSVAFPKREAEYLGHAKSGMQIAFEPSSLAKVRDNDYLRRFALDCRNSGIPIFLRFASEFNGLWTPYHADPEAYKAAFRTVAGVMHRTASNVAMVWCPNEIPQEPIDRYYPGQTAVDWVGVNFYSVIYNDADRSRGAEWRWPTDQIDYVYRKYSGRHPIMVGEWAATHLSSVDHVERPDFAIRKIRQFYAVAPLLYPRLKAINWLSFNALKYARGDRQLNNYSLYDSDPVASAYAAEVHRDWYVDRVGGNAIYRWVELGPKEKPKTGDHIAIYFRSYDPAARLTVKADDKTISTDGGEAVTEFDAPDATRWEATLNDSKGKPAGRSNR
ncbi:hypothetical protein BH11ARM2_BH11ARM2_30020 [soil metagenome]